MYCGLARSYRFGFQVLRCRSLLACGLEVGYDRLKINGMRLQHLVQAFTGLFQSFKVGFDLSMGGNEIAHCLPVPRDCYGRA